MFICADCIKEHYYKPVMLFIMPLSKGPCECCHYLSICYDIPSSQLTLREQNQKGPEDLTPP